MFAFFEHQFHVLANILRENHSRHMSEMRELILKQSEMNAEMQSLKKVHGDLKEEVMECLVKLTSMQSMLAKDSTLSEAQLAKLDSHGLPIADVTKLENLETALKQDPEVKAALVKFDVE